MCFRSFPCYQQSSKALSSQKHTIIDADLEKQAEINYSFISNWASILPESFDKNFIAFIFEYQINEKFQQYHLKI